MADSDKSKSAKGTQRGIEEQAKAKTAKPKKAGPLEKTSPRWWAPLMVTLMIIGLIVVVVAYLFSGDLPVPGLGNGNLFIGFGIMLVGFLMTMGWR
jgi:uncharacterized RDD family membrane protein YckC